MNGEDLALTRRDRDAASTLLCEAFFDNPAHTYIFPDEQSRAADLSRLMRVNLNGQMSVGKSFGRRGADGALEALAFWHPPGAPKANMFALVRYGFLTIPLRCGIDAFQRLLHTVKIIEARRLEALGGRESWYLNNMVVSRRQRGCGLGRELLIGQLRATVDPSAFPASLATQKPENVNFTAS